MKAIKGIQRIGQCTMYKSSFLIKLHCQQSIEFLFKIASGIPKFTLKQSHRHYCLKFLDVVICWYPQRCFWAKGSDFASTSLRVRMERLCASKADPALLKRTKAGSIPRNQLEPCRISLAKWCALHKFQLIDAWNPCGENMNERLMLSFPSKIPPPHTHTHTKKKSSLWIGSLMKLYETLSKSTYPYHIHIISYPYHYIKMIT